MVISYYEYNKSPIRIFDFLSNRTLASLVSFEGVETAFADRKVYK